MKQRGTNLVFRMLYGMVAFVLLWEWLRPMEMLVELGNVGLFLVFIGLSVLLHFYRVRKRWIFLILLGYLLSALYFIYYRDFYTFAELQWMALMVGNFIDNVITVGSGAWEEVSNQFRTMLFFLLLWMMAYLLHYWLIVRKRIFLFFFMSIMYVTILDTFTTYDGDGAIVRLVVIGFLALGCLRMERLVNERGLQLDNRQNMRWLVPLLAFILLSASIGYVSPKSSAKWSDPVPFLVSQSEKFTGSSNGKGVATVGYDEDDSRLGGGFNMDDTLVFTAKTDDKHYWKIEMKDFYTGKGWESGPDAGPEDLISGTNKIYGYDSFEGAEGLHATVNAEEKMSYIAYPTPVDQVDVQTDNPNQTFRYNWGTEKFTVQGLDLYRIEYQLSVYNVEQLREVTDMSDEDVLFHRPLFQLPESLPKRVKDLAIDLTESEDNWFDKAKAIESYLKGPEFTYEHEDIPYPEEDEDFVDQFLFETKMGYCDHFSTAMVIMLRSIGIPAKWVKGYSEGEYVETMDGKSIYEIRNNNAHSWVEVQFPTGAVPFEPTKGFTNSSPFEYNTGSTMTSESGVREQGAQQVQQERDMPEQPTQNLEETGAETSTQKTSSTIVGKIKQNTGLIVFWSIVLLVMALWLYKNRQKWIPRLWIAYFRRKSDSESFTKAYFVLLKQLNRRGIKRKPSETLREYASYIDESFMMQDMGQLTVVFEKWLYGGNQDPGNWVEKWEKIMKRTIA
ncbi:MAG: transglutaminase domain-containing protein [Bacillus sp. (in: firmicutes)]